MLCISIVQLAVLLTGPNEMDQELSKIQPPAKKVPPAENQEDQEDARDIADIANIRAIPAFEGFPINPVADAKLAVSFCSKNCPEIPKASFWDVPAPIMFERGSTCNSHGECDTKVPTHMAQEQYDSLARRLRFTSHTRIAIVGSSGSLKWGNSSHAPYGPEIDSHDIVVRINGAPAVANTKDGWARRPMWHMQPPKVWRRYQANIKHRCRPSSSKALAYVRATRKGSSKRTGLGSS